MWIFRQNPLNDDINQAVTDGNALLTSSEQLFNDATAQGQQLFNGMAGQALDTASQLAGAATGGRIQQDAGAVIQEGAEGTSLLANDASTLLSDGTQVFSDVAGQAVSNAQNFLGGMMNGGSGRLQQDTASDIQTFNDDIQTTITDAENTFNSVSQAAQGALNNMVTQGEQAFGLGSRRIQQDVAADATQVLDDMNTVAGDVIQAGNDAFQVGTQAFQNLAGSMARRR